jgi:hypothetical protein
MIKTLARYALNVLSGEWIINCVTRSNGGAAILMRAAQFAVCVLLTHTWLLWFLTDFGKVEGNGRHLFFVSRYITEYFPFIGVAFGAAYAAFYSRFAAQWEYLAGVYNDIKRAEVDIAVGGEGPTAGRAELAQWKKAFIEDALSLHLAYKPLFASVVADWIQHSDVAPLFVDECGTQVWRHRVYATASNVAKAAVRRNCT